MKFYKSHSLLKKCVIWFFKIYIKFFNMYEFQNLIYHMSMGSNVTNVQSKVGGYDRSGTMK
jgi:hypothetical protein